MISNDVELLILGAGWTSTFLRPLCVERGIRHAATTRSGRNATIPFEFSPDSDDLEPYRRLPDAKTVLITFPITAPGGSSKLVNNYNATRGGSTKAAFIQLGATSIWDKTQATTTRERYGKATWYNRHSPILQNERANAEEELLRLAPEIPTTVLNLAGLWGGHRSTKNWVSRVAPTKAALKLKGSIHMIHGIDVARAILAVHKDFHKAAGERWILTDGRVYDWWDLASAWGSEIPSSIAEDERGPQPRWVRELMQEEGIRALPRDVDMLGRALDSTDFWVEFGLSPIKARLEGNE
ncbi:hypothetical protein AX16_004620 [Volvariella volvacea WC 439]|nr:hypothetical protein AX16_004620 [Volvariella volvacea WC 439]